MSNRKQQEAAAAAAAAAAVQTSTNHSEEFTSKTYLSRHIFMLILQQNEQQVCGFTRARMDLSLICLLVSDHDIFSIVSIQDTGIFTSDVHGRTTTAVVSRKFHFWFL